MSPSIRRNSVRIRTPLCRPLGEKISVNWRFRVPDGEKLRFDDGHFGPQHAVTNRDFGDFLVWRKDDCPSYQLACTVDDAEMGITEAVRGADLIRSTFRQLLLYRALGLPAPEFFHCPLMNDSQGVGSPSAMMPSASRRFGRRA